MPLRDNAGGLRWGEWIDWIDDKVDSILKQVRTPEATLSRTGRIVVQIQNPPRRFDGSSKESIDPQMVLSHGVHRMA